MSYLVINPWEKPELEALGVVFKGNNVKTKAWTCDKCHRPTKLVLVSVLVRHEGPAHRFRSQCCRYTVQPTKVVNA